jgi:hypothetical protein
VLLSSFNLAIVSAFSVGEKKIHRAELSLRVVADGAKHINNITFDYLTVYVGILLSLVTILKV